MNQSFTSGISYNWKIILLAWLLLFLLVFSWTPTTISDTTTINNASTTKIFECYKTSNSIQCSWKEI